LKKIKGIGDWTVVFICYSCCSAADVFPTGDLAMMNALKEVKKLPRHASKEEIIEIAEKLEALSVRRNLFIMASLY
jgi:DNA-3-methyladenine glycosylase II